MFFANEVRIGGLGGGSCLTGTKVGQIGGDLGGPDGMPFEGHAPGGKTVTVAIDSFQVRFSWGS